MNKLLESKYRNNIRTAIWCDRLFKNDLKFVSIQIDNRGMLYAQCTNTLKRLFLSEYQENEYLFYFLGYRPTCLEVEKSRYTPLELDISYKVLNDIKAAFGGDIKKVGN